MDKKKYFVNIGTKEISQIQYDNNDNFVIHATDDEVRLLRAKMDNMHSAESRNFFRAHVPIMPYHMDKSNDDYDLNAMNAYQMLYELGDEETKSHIKDAGILNDNHI